MAGAVSPATPGRSGVSPSAVGTTSLHSRRSRYCSAAHPMGSLLRSTLSASVPESPSDPVDFAVA